jgi:hypothetical protein
VLERLWHEHQSGRAIHYKKLWTLITFLAWRRAQAAAIEAADLLATAEGNGLDNLCDTNCRGKHEEPRVVFVAGSRAAAGTGPYNARCVVTRTRNRSNWFIQ